MSATATEVSTQEIVDLWGSFHPPRYLIDEQIFEQHTFEAPTYDQSASEFVYDEQDRLIGFIVIKYPAVPDLYGTGGGKDTAHLCCICYRDLSLASLMLKEAKTVLKRQKMKRLEFGGDNLHIFPGCPRDCGRITALLQYEGFKLNGEVLDLESDITNYEPPEEVTAALSGQKATIRQARDGDLKSLEKFLRREFKGRWHYDVMDQIEAEEDPGIVTVMIKADQVEGFALTQHFGGKRPISGAVWRASLGRKWGALGPIGVAKELRGKGLGDALLAGALQSLQRRGVAQTIVDWTSEELAGWYGAHGFEPTRRYLPATLTLK